MLKRLRLLLITGICLIGLLIAVPSLVSEKTRRALPSWMPQKTMVLGLDLQGGVHLLLEMDVKDLLEQRNKGLIALLRPLCRQQKIHYKNLRIKENEVSIQLMNRENLSLLKKVIDKEEGPGQWEVQDTQEYTRIRFSKKAHEALVRQAMDKSVEILRKRIDQTGISEPILQSQGRDRIILQIPGFDDPARVRALLGTTAKLTFQWVEPKSSRSDLLPFENYDERRIPVDREVLMTGEDILDAKVLFNPNEMGVNKPMVSLTFTAKGTKIFSTLTQPSSHGRALAIILDHKILSAPTIQSHIPNGRAQISGSFSLEEAQNLALMINSGALPAPLHVLEEKIVGPGLGQDSIIQGTRATVLAIVAVAVWMIVIYSAFGLFTVIGLSVNLCLLVAAMVMLGATLTLPGLAGIALTVGMAVDANVLINERIKEEKRKGQSLYQAIELGYSRARKAILDSNITTLTAALILYFMGTGPVKGFAVTMALGILISLFTAIGLTKILVNLWLKRAKPHRLWI